MSKSYFTREEFNISGKPIPYDVAEKIDAIIEDLNPVRKTFGKPIIISKKSGYRSVEWEKSHGRSGNSQHTFKGKGAADLTVKDKSDLPELIELLINHSSATSIAYYPNAGFVHIDYRDWDDCKRKYFTSTNASKWTFIKNV